MPCEHRAKLVQSADIYSREVLLYLLEAFDEEQDPALRKLMARQVLECMKHSNYLTIHSRQIVDHLHLLKEALEWRLVR